MSKKRCGLISWSMDVYDYEKQAITDEAVGGIDLRKGRWIHCKWCNTTLKTTLFSLVSWKSHKKRKTHLIREQKILDDGGSQPQVISCSSQSSALSATTSLPEGSQPSQTHESLMFVRRDLYKNKQHQARHERDVNNVINAMTNLISDQQSDMKTLQDKVHDIEHQIQAVKKDLRICCRKNKQTMNMQTPPKKIIATTSFPTQYTPESPGFSRNTQGGHGHCTWFRAPGRKPSSNNKAMKRSTSDMDMFEKRFRLTGRG